MDFIKMHGIGNDFILIDCIKQSFTDEELSKIAVGACHRNFGIGSDGLILVCTSEVCDFKMRMLNPDGSEAEMCGNGIRVFAKYIYDYKLSEKEEITVETLAGVKIIKIFAEKGKCNYVQVDMGEPRLNPKKIPVLGFEGENVINQVLVVDDIPFNITCVNMGNPHCVTIVNNADDIDLSYYGPLIENHSQFPERTNVEFIEILDRENVKMRVWERGAAETLACGTGACASAVAAMLNNKTEKKVNMHLAGGDLVIEWTDEGRVLMTGPAEEVFVGKVTEETMAKWLK